MESTTQTQGWHVGKWGTYGWLETIARGIGIGLAFVALALSTLGRDMTISGNSELAAVILLALLTLLWTGVLYMRYQQREIIAMIFGIFNALGHAALLIALLKLPEQNVLAIGFAIAYIVAELIKRVFLTTTGYTESGRTPERMLMVSSVFTGVYILLLVFLII